MTHEELLAKIDNTADRLLEIIINAPARMDIMNMSQPKDILAPLRAVLELHKPSQIDNALWCNECSKRFENSGYYECYPCPTIQAIEKALV